MSKGLVVVGLVVLIGFCKADETESKACFLRDGYSSDKPFPSLTQCYKNNQNACCVSAHDAFIEHAYAELLSSTCLREYQELEHFFCLGCNPNMYDYIQWYVPSDGDCDSARKFGKRDDACTFEKDARGKYGMIKICDSFLESMLYDDASCKVVKNDCAIDKYDNCGLNLEVEGSTMGWFPSQHFVTNTSEYSPLMFLDEIRPPYFYSDMFDISYESLKDDNSAPDSDYYYESWTNNVCFDSATSMHLGFVAVLVALVAHVGGNFM